MTQTKTPYGETMTYDEMHEMYGRGEAPGVNIAAAIRAAIYETKAGLQAVLWGDSRIGILMIRYAKYRLAVAMGSESLAIRAIDGAQLPATNAFQSSDKIREDFLRDRAQLELGILRTWRHPGLSASLCAIETDLASARAQQSA